MKRAFLIYNPASGRRRERRAEKIARAAEVLRAAGIETEVSATTGPGSAIEQAKKAIYQGFDTVIACGGDGTVNEVLNGLMVTDAEATLGVIPLGSGNLIATDLGIPRRPEAAARSLLTCERRELHPGVIHYETKTGLLKRWFIVAAGVGADAELMYRTAIAVKERYGMYAYFLEMVRMALRRHLPMFDIEWLAASGERQHASISLVMAVRAARFPGIMRRVRLGSKLSRGTYRLLLFRTDKVRHFLNFFFSVLSGWNWKVAPVELADSSWFRCTRAASENEARIHCEADGEILGRLPVEVSIEPRTFRLLTPPA